MWGTYPSGPFDWNVYWKIFVIDFENTTDVGEFLDIGNFFGLVASLYYLFLCVFQQLYNKKLIYHLMMGVISGILGSLQFWIVYGNGFWYNSLLHGTIWGALVGYGIWANVRDAEQKQII